MPETKKEFIKTNTIKDRYKSVYEMRSADDAVQEIITRFSAAIEKVLAESVDLAKKEKRTTVLFVDVQLPIDKTIGKKHLNWEDILRGILQQTPTDLTKISKGISDYIKEKEKRTILINQKGIRDRISKEFKLTKTDSEKIIKYTLAEISNL